jgi:hypothetical protein
VQYQRPQFDIIGDAQPQRPRSRTHGWAAKLNIFFYDPVFTIFWILMHVLDERSPLYGYDAVRAIERDARVFVTLEARDPKEHGPMPTRLIPSSEMHRNWCGQDVTTK